MKNAAALALGGILALSRLSLAAGPANDRRAYRREVTRRTNCYRLPGRAEVSRAIQMWHVLISQIDRRRVRGVEVFDLGPPHGERIGVRRRGIRRQTRPGRSENPARRGSPCAGG